jgi:hypothetical protein
MLQSSIDSLRACTQPKPGLRNLVVSYSSKRGVIRDTRALHSEGGRKRTLRVRKKKDARTKGNIKKSRNPHYEKKVQVWVCSFLGDRRSCPPKKNTV